MTIFNPENKKQLTYGECLDPIFRITDPDDAKQYKETYINWIDEHVSIKDRAGSSAEEIANYNIGYYAGYGTPENRIRIDKLFNCTHPIFGEAKSEEK